MNEEEGIEVEAVGYTVRGGLTGAAGRMIRSKYRAILTLRDNLSNSERAETIEYLLKDAERGKNTLPDLLAILEHEARGRLIPSPSTIAAETLSEVIGFLDRGDVGSALARVNAALASVSSRCIDLVTIAQEWEELSAKSGTETHGVARKLADKLRDYSKG